MTAIAEPAVAVSTADARFRYGIVFGAVLTLTVFEILSPDTSLARALDLALAGAALTVTVATSRAREPVRRRRATIVGGAALAVVILVATGVLSPAVTWAIATLLIGAIPVTIAGGLLRLIRAEGVTVEVVAGALAVYLTVGLLFASVVAFVAHVQSPPFFKQGANVPAGDDAYYSFTVLTTTGFGDYTPATRLGHALAVLEMLSGQLYLVTVIGIVVGNFVGRRRRRELT
jgi:hypothetical protein